MIAPCPGCHNALNFDQTFDGQVVACPYCATKIRPHFPEQQPIPAAPYYPPQYAIGTVRKRGPEYHPGIAALLSFFIPGAGQLYCGDVIGGMCIFMLWVALLFLGVFTLGISLVCAFIVWVSGVAIAYSQATASQRN